MDELSAETDLIGMTADIVSAFVSNNAIAPTPCRA
jgi:predicted transcriptional regulator